MNINEISPVIYMRHKNIFEHKGFDYNTNLRGNIVLFISQYLFDIT